jgi:hypothetical protein
MVYKDFHMAQYTLYVNILSKAHYASKIFVILRKCQTSVTHFLSIGDHTLLSMEWHESVTLKVP